MAFLFLKLLISLIYLYNELINNVFPSRAGIDLQVDARSPNTGWRLFNPYQCGISNTDRIIGGKLAAIGQFPWIARLGYEDFERPIFRCAGSLITDDYVVTAAHCVTHLPRQAPLTLIRLGEHFTDQEIDCENGVCAPPVQDFYPERVIVHAHYDRPSHRNDIALIRLDHKVVFSDFVLPICIPYNTLLDDDLVDKTLEVAGWGFTDPQVNRMSTRLYSVRINGVPLERCIKTYRFLPITDAQICAGGIVGKDSCAGDSGGPLMKVEAYQGPPRYFLVGIVSFGDIKCGSRLPAVYTDVRYYTNWILHQIQY